MEAREMMCPASELLELIRKYCMITPNGYGKEA
jgi:hypothetical protein